MRKSTLACSCIFRRIPEFYFSIYNNSPKYLSSGIVEREQTEHALLNRENTILEWKVNITHITR